MGLLAGVPLTSASSANSLSTLAPTQPPVPSPPASIQGPSHSMATLTASGLTHHPNLPPNHPSLHARPPPSFAASLIHSDRGMTRSSSAPPGLFEDAQGNNPNPDTSAVPSAPPVQSDPPHPQLQQLQQPPKQPPQQPSVPPTVPNSHPRIASPTKASQTAGRPSSAPPLPPHQGGGLRHPDTVPMEQAPYYYATHQQPQPGQPQRDPQVVHHPVPKQPIPRPATPGAIGERIPTRMDHVDAQQQQDLFPFAHPLSVVDRIQEDFPRTPSPRIAAHLAEAAGARGPQQMHHPQPHSLADHQRSSRSLGVDEMDPAISFDHVPDRVPSSSPLSQGQAPIRQRHPAANHQQSQQGPPPVSMYPAGPPPSGRPTRGQLPNQAFLEDHPQQLQSDYEFLYDTPDQGGGPRMGSFPTFGNFSRGYNSGGAANPAIFNGQLQMVPPFANYPAGVGNETSEDLKAQMAAFINTQQQLYAQQLAQIATINAMNNWPGNAAGMGRNGVQGPGGNLWDGVHHGNDRTRGMETVHAGYSREDTKTSMGGFDRRNKPVLDSKRRGQRPRRLGQHYDDMGGSGNADGKRYTHGGQGGENPQPRSPLLEDFRATSVSVGRSVSLSDAPATSFGHVLGLREWLLSELKGHVVEFATDQHGSRFIQQKLETASPEDVGGVLSESLVDAQRLMTDVFGNYVVQKLLDYGGPKAIAAIMNDLKDKMLVLSLHMYGCRVVQKALEVLGTIERSQLVSELDGHVLKCIRDQNGNHVIQKCIELVAAGDIQFIVDAIVGQAVVLAEHSYGCRVVQRILEHGSELQKDPIMVEIMDRVHELIRDQYGNYVIQHVVEHGRPDERTKVIGIVQNEVCGLSQHKFASNVVERCLQHGTEKQREILIEILIVGDNASEPSPLNHLVKDQFGNYVVQRVLDVADVGQRERVVNILKNQVNTIKKYSYGKHILLRLETNWIRGNNGAMSTDSRAYG